MRWGEQGGQAILSFRALVQSNRFERAWTLLAHTYKAEVTTPTMSCRYAVGNDRCQYESYDSGYSGDSTSGRALV